MIIDYHDNRKIYNRVFIQFLLNKKNVVKIKIVDPITNYHLAFDDFFVRNKKFAKNSIKIF